MTDEATNRYSRREYLKRSALLALAGTSVYAAGSDTIRVGLVGCGGRGTAAARESAGTSPGVELVAMGDLFPDCLDASLDELTKALGPERCKVTRERCFAGFDAYKQVIAAGVDLVILAAPAHFRPLHLKAAVEAGKHVFMEKPVAVDPVGIRSVLESTALAKQKNLALVAGTQRRHDPKYIEVMKRIHDGAIGEVVGAQCYWLRGHLWTRERQPAWSDMEWQIRNHVYFTWLCGDCVVETLLHNLDVVSWAMGDVPPKVALGFGGRQVRTEAIYGNVWDHFALEYEYANGVRTMGISREMPDCEKRVAERIVGTKGVALCNLGEIRGEMPFKYSGPKIQPYEQEHVDMIRSIRSGTPLNEGRRMAESNLTAIIGRMSAYTGQPVDWQWALTESRLDLTPPRYVLGDLPVAPVAVPGVTRLI